MSGVMRSVDTKPSDLAAKMRQTATEREMEAASATDESRARYLRATAQSFHTLADAISGKPRDIIGRMKDGA